MDNIKQGKSPQDNGRVDKYILVWLLVMVDPPFLPFVLARVLCVCAKFVFVCFYFCDCFLFSFRSAVLGRAGLFLTSGWDCVGAGLARGVE